jgi:hypothetical protein
MTPGQSRRLARKSTLLQKQVLEELHAIAKSIERAETSVVALKDQMEAVNLKHKDRKTTSDDIAYLEDLLRCARKKLGWEKQMSSLARKMPELLTNITTVMNDKENPPSNETRILVLKLLTTVQEAMGRLEKAKG